MQETTTLMARKAIETGVKEGKSYQCLSEELSLSLRAVRKWGQKAKKNASLVTIMGRPKKGSLSSFSALLRQQIDKYRPNEIGKTGWSAKTISVELNFDTILKGESKPSISRKR